MNKRAIVNVATGEFYCKMQDRLINSFAKSISNVFVKNSETPIRSCVDKVYAVEDEPECNNTGIDLIIWRDCLPP
jgi:hypothetical protein